MKQNPGLIQGLFLCLTPLVTSSVLIASPTIAATLASSEAKVNIGNFSHKPWDVQTNTNTNTSTIANNGQVNVNANADAVFPFNPSLPGNPAYNISLSKANGDGSNYFGLAQSNAALIGYNFIVQSNEEFSFDFQAFLDLKTSIDSPEFEHASAEGGMSLDLYDTTDSNNWLLVDRFTLSGGLFTSEKGDFINLQPSSHITFNPNQTGVEHSFGGTQESIKAAVEGNYSRQFGRLTYLTLIEGKGNQAIVKAAVPESSTVVGLLLFGLSFLGYGLKMKGD